ncbi:MAG TPA: cobalamin-dependent protein [Chloroflexota bacterium]|nr:cobalamin-dependent protein [Chloroflexota bacterium]
MVDIIRRRFVESPIKRILFVEPQSGYSTGFNDTVRVETLGPEYLAGSVRDIAECRLCDLRTSRGDLVASMRDFQPQLVAIKCGYTTDVPVVADLARQVKQLDPSVPIIVGGHHISLSPEDLFIPEIDGIAYGEAEDIFPLIVQVLGAGQSLSRVPYMYYRDTDGQFRSTVVPQKIANTVLHNSAQMNTRPFPMRELCDPYRDEYYFLYYRRPYSVETARGCRYRCSFCSVWQFHHGVYKVEGWQRTFEEISRIPDGSYVNIVDDLAMQVMPHEDYRESDAWKLAQSLIQSKNKRRFWMQCRADNIVRNKELYTAWAEAGLDMVLIGLESDDPAELKRVNKGSRVSVNEEAVRFLHSIKVKVWGAQIVFTDWLADRFEHLIEYNKRLGIECPQFTIHTPLPGTVDWKKYYNQLITTDRRYFDFLHPVLPTRLPIREFIERYVKLYRECHMSLRDLMELVRSGRVTLQGMLEFAKKFRHLTDPATYQSAIDLHERVLAGKPV